MTSTDSPPTLTRPPGQVDVAIIGAGISGLVVGSELARRGVRVAVLEAGARAGGVIRSERHGDFLAELGPNTVLATSGEIGRLIDAVGLAERIRWADPGASRRYIARRGRLYRLPSGPGGFLVTRLFSLRAKLRLMREPFVAPSAPDARESVADFVARRLGQEFVDYAINPMVSGVYAGRPEELEVRSAFPKVHALEQRFGGLIKGAVKGARERRRLAGEGEVARDRARLFSFPDGLEELPRALAEQLGGALHLEHPVQRLARDGDHWRVELHDPDGAPRTLSARAVVPAVDVPALRRLLPDPSLACLDEIPYPPVSVVFFGYQEAPGGRRMDGFGHLIPEKEGLGTLGTLWSSCLFAARAPVGGAALTTFVGGRRDPSRAALGDDELAALVRQDLERLMGITRAPDVVHIGRYPRAIPQYVMGHAERAAAVTALEEASPGLFVASNAVGGVSVGDRIRVGAAMAARIEPFIRGEDP